MALLNYLIDAYLFVAASALASNTVFRSSFGAAFPLFATQMYDALNPRWASTLLGFIALAMIPIPVILKAYAVLDDIGMMRGLIGLFLDTGTRFGSARNMHHLFLPLNRKMKKRSKSNLRSPPTYTILTSFNNCISSPSPT